MRRARSAFRPLSRALTLGLAMLALAGCFPFKSREAFDRQRRLLTLAASEATQIVTAQHQLERLLNLAYQQNLRRLPSDASATLETARRVVDAAAPSALSEHLRLSAWISISQLARRAQNGTLARQACDEAVRFLRRLEPLRQRSEYLSSVATETAFIHGDPTAVLLLRDGADWTRHIADAALRRKALASIAWQIFTLKDDAVGLGVLRHDADAAWRTDTLTGFAGAPMHRQLRSSAYSFGRDISFESVYQRK